ncbi:MAG: Stealth CR1 domain-containing protein [Flavobacteriaceae bacterium]|nr:Stealth CR1 domain-containing protein [Flavobacteriaceae bacterium]MCY4217150.1 Stealth CR1 domain-containing protein [Flavobacteriaceae bacterium]MCY4253893.1 Stealth CR1 domain-containing protein [Flavobacteriaceae bacterium]
MKQKENYPIDAVVTWVDPSDPIRQTAIKSFLAQINDSMESKKNAIGKNIEEIKYTVHSILKYAPFIRNIFIITDQQIPRFLKSSNRSPYSKVKVVDHQTIFKKDIAMLPTFNARSIETKLYEVPRLSEHFIYFNDDILLLQKTTPTDFFINGKPVLRGKWKRFKENIFYKQLSNKKKKHQPGHILAQEKSAKIIGFKKLYKFHHTPHPMRVSTLKTFYSDSRNIELNNIQYKFRNHNQFLNSAISYHLEIKNKTCFIKQDYQLLHFRHYKKPFFWLKFKLLHLGNRKNKLFLNLQDLGLCPENKLAFIIEWLEKKYKI